MFYSLFIAHSFCTCRSLNLIVCYTFLFSISISSLAHTESSINVSSVSKSSGSKADSSQRDSSDRDQYSRVSKLSGSSFSVVQKRCTLHISTWIDRQQACSRNRPGWNLEGVLSWILAFCDQVVPTLSHSFRECSCGVVLSSSMKHDLIAPTQRGLVVRAA